MTEHAWEDLEATTFRLAKYYKRAHQCGYVDSNGRSTLAYLESISKSLRDLEAPPPPGSRRQTLIPDAAVIVQEPVASSKPLPKARIHWPSWLKLHSLHRKTESGDELLKDIV
uniref:Zn(2)-C6 fungal-type domain-containing protein n=1 Tax=Ganoderma boninense TaxID=34458 RepID=A0A5K1K1A6_9APHY|nr:Zn(2)-C6 fungal-type domain-containing protein [Ganoderma boninense]